MSDDRFKQARRSLIDKQNQRQQDSGEVANHGGDDRTQMVDLDELVAHKRNMSLMEDTGQDGDDDQATQMFEVPAMFRKDHHEQSDADDDYDDAGPATELMEGFNPAMLAQAQARREQYDSAQQPKMKIPAGDEDSEGYEGSTQFIDLNAFATQGEQFAPEAEEAGYEGSTQFVDLSALTAGLNDGSSATNAIANDQVLKQGYNFQSSDIHIGEVAIINGSNLLGEPVILKRVWEGNAAGMTPQLRQRIAQLNALKHPNLIAMNGLFSSDTGLWVELEKPQGTPLSDYLTEHGVQDQATVHNWAHTIGDVLKTVHANELAYANLTADAVWVGDDGTIKLEPFDMLRIEERGDLGLYGAPELKVPLEQRQLSPATDIYSLAVIIVAALTGVPPQLSKTAELKALGKHLNKALADDATQRFVDVDSFLKGIKAKGGGASSGPDVKKLALVAIILIVAAGGAFMFMPSDPPTSPQPAQPAPQAQADAAAAAPAKEEADQASPEKSDDDQSTPTPQDDNGTQDAADGAVAQDAADGAVSEQQGTETEPSKAAQIEGHHLDGVQLPGPVNNDPRITSIEAAFHIKPPENSTQTPDPKRAQQLFKEAKEKLVDIETLPDNRMQDQYYAALASLTQIARMNQGLSSEEQELFDDIYNKKIIQDYHMTLNERIESFLKSNTLSQARLSYRRLYSIYPEANDVQFFNQYNTADITVVATTDSDENND